MVWFMNGKQQEEIQGVSKELRHFFFFLNKMIEICIYMFITNLKSISKYKTVYGNRQKFPKKECE